MKKRLQLPIGLIRMAFVAFAFLFFAVGCEKEEVSTSPFTTQENLEQENFSITGAKQWFESNIDSKLNANNVLENSTCWNFMASPDRKLNWENAYEYATATSNIIELSISYENGKRPGLIIKRDNSINLEDEYTGNKKVPKIALKYIIIQNKATGKIEGIVMRVVADLLYNKDIMNDIHYEQVVPTEFTGRISFYTWSGDFIGGYKYADGLIKKQIFSEQRSCSNEIKASTRDLDCTRIEVIEYTQTVTYWFQQEGDGEYEYLDTHYGPWIPTGHFVGIECDYVIDPGDGGSNNGGGLVIPSINLPESEPCGEDGVPCSHCTNKKQDADETGVDCGGVDCITCEEEEEGAGDCFFDFQDTGTNFQACGVLDVTFDFLDPSIQEIGVQYYTYTIDAIYIGLPIETWTGDIISPEAAALLASQALNWAEQQMQNKYMSPWEDAPTGEGTGTLLENEFLSFVKNYLEDTGVGGRVSFSNPYGDIPVNNCK